MGGRDKADKRMILILTAILFVYIICLYYAFKWLKDIFIYLKKKCLQSLHHALDQRIRMIEEYM